jgi:hypothetical protein
MPIYKFQVHTPLAMETAIARIQAITAEPESFWESTRYTFWSRPGKQTRPFRGEVVRYSLILERAIGSRYAWQLQIHGRIDAMPCGSRMSVIMYLHPIAILIVCGVFSVAVRSAWNAFNTSQSLSGPVFMFIVAVALTYVCFFPEAANARRLLENAINR